MNFNRIIILFVLCTIPFGLHLYGQRTSGNPGASDAGLDIETSDPQDTVPPTFHYRQAPDQIYIYDVAIVDSSYLLQYDMSRMSDVEHITLGNQGSAAFPLTRSISNDIGFDFGFHQYDIYRKRTGDLRYFKLRKAISDLYFSPNGQGNFIVKALYADNFANNVDLSIDYARINETGIYQNQQTKSTAFSAGLHFHNRSAYEMYAEFHANNHNESQNGGVSDTTLFDLMFNDNRMNIPVYFSDASSRHENFKYELYNIFKLGSDSTAVRSELSFHTSYNHGYYRFYDDDLSDADLAFYESFVTDDRGIRSRLSFKRILNDFSVKTQLKKSIEFIAGSSFDYYDLFDEVSDHSIQNLSIYGKSKINITDKINLSAKLEIGFADIAGSLGLDSKINLPIKSLFQLEGGFRFLRRNPSYLSEHLVITNQTFWTNSFTKPIESEIWAQLYIPKTKSKILFSQTVTDNAIYLDNSSLYAQSDEIYSVTKLGMSQAVKWGILRFEHYAFFQSINNNLYNLPDLFTKQSLYAKFKLFKNNLENEIGFEHRFIPETILPKYNPIIGQLYGSDEIKNAQSIIDFFALFNIDDFKFLLRASNLLDIFSNEIYYPIYRYPQYDFNIRISARWTIRD